MIQRLSHTTVYVLDQERARKFYTEQLGFQVRTDQTMGTFRWLTVGPKGQPDLEMVLMPISSSPHMDEATCAQLRAIIEKGAFGVGVLETADCRATYEELAAKGVRFQSPPVERPYGTEAMLQDDSGNYFSLVQRPHQGTHQGTR
ncbi:MAG TPA: VOC family protein [Kofleriaceae bacterium]|nr:VOC family protein [Kofleriaceae bacterium]